MLNVGQVIYLHIEIVASVLDLLRRLVLQGVENFTFSSVNKVIIILDWDNNVLAK